MLLRLPEGDEKGMDYRFCLLNKGLPTSHPLASARLSRWTNGSDRREALDLQNLYSPVRLRSAPPTHWVTDPQVAQ
jgi:hypothetical protein